MLVRAAHETMMSMHQGSGSVPTGSAAPADRKPALDPARLNALTRDMTGTIGEWAQSGNEADAYPSVVMEKTDKSTPASSKLRYPWEAPAQIGFRTVTEKVQAP